MTISETAIQKITASNKAKGHLMIAFNIGEKTVLNWLGSKNVKLTTPDAIRAIAEGTGLTEAEILTD